MTELSLNEQVAMNVVHSRVLAAAATKAWIDKHGDVDACGFAWITTHEKGNTKLGRALKEAGFKKAYSGGMQLWNPSNSWTQSMGALEAGADAAAQFLSKQLGVQFYTGSRMD